MLSFLLEASEEHLFFDYFPFSLSFFSLSLNLSLFGFIFGLDTIFDTYFFFLNEI